MTYEEIFKQAVAIAFEEDVNQAFDFMGELLSLWHRRGITGKTITDAKCLIFFMAGQQPSKQKSRLLKTFQVDFEPTPLQSWKIGIMMGAMLRLYGVERPANAEAEARKLEGEFALLDALLRPAP